MKKGRLVIALVLNILVVGAVGFGLANLLVGFWGVKPISVSDAFRYFTNASGAFVALMALIYVILLIAALNGKRIPKGFAVLKLMATVSSAITLIVVLAYLAPTSGDWTIVYDPHYYLWLHAVAPFLAILAFIFENQPKLRLRTAFFAIIPPLVYGGVMVPLLHFSIIPAEPRLYDFLYINTAKWWNNVAWAVGVLIGAFLIGLILLLLRSIGKPAEEAKAVEAPAEPVPEEKKEEIPPYEEKKEEPAVAEEQKPEEPKVEEPKAEEPKPEEPKAEEAKPAPKPEPAKPTYAPAPAKRVAPRPQPRPAVSAPTNTGIARTYHISKQQASGRWQVKLAKGQKVIRVFDTQSEAIAFTKGLVESRGGSYRIHSVKGKIRR